MKLATQFSNNEVETLGIEKSQKFGMSKDAQEMIFTMFTKNIYSNPIGSVVREITSNCFDSHKEAGVNEAVIVKLTKENTDFYISFIDNGMGMSRDRITNVYAQYFNSTKRNDNNQIGGFGIGGKTPLAYAESFFLITRYAGVKYTYSIRKGTDSPVLDLLSKEKTAERNGTIVKIPVKGSDVNTFEREINRQLFYFENVIFEGFSSTVKNDYKIIEGKNFFYRGDDYNSYAHICLGRVAYPIDYNVFDSNDIDQNDWTVPIAIKINIGEINVTVSREAIDYTPETKKLIKKKLIAAKEELVAMLEKQHEKLNTLEEYYQVENSHANLMLSNGYVINIQSMLYGKLYNKPTLKKLDAIDIPTQGELVHMFYDVSMLGKKGKRESSWDKSVKSMDNNNIFLLGTDEKMPRKKNAYMKFTYKHFFAIARKEYSQSYLKLMIKKITPDKSTASSRTIFNQFRELQKDAHKLIESKTKDYSSIVVPDGFTVSQTKYDPNYEVVVGFVSTYGVDRIRHKITELENCKARFYYGTTDDENLLKEYKGLYDILFNATETKKFAIGNSYGGYPVRFVAMAKGNVKYVKEMKNFKPVSEALLLFQRKRNKVLNHIEKTKFMADYDKLNRLFLNENLFTNIDAKFAKIIVELKKIWKKYNSSPKMSLYYSHGSIAKKVFALKEDQVNFQGENLIKIVIEKTEKNHMMKFISITDNFNPQKSNYNDEDTANLMQLLDLIYVK